VANFLVFGYMAVMRIGLNVNTLPVASIAIGVGVDYGIYFLSRVKEEYKRAGDLPTAIFTSILTTGKAITFTALTIILSVTTWIFSSIKFQAEMGMLLSIVTLFHLAGALIFLPALLTVFRPKFIINASDNECLTTSER
ncbi:MAG: MMPL family transporter, partial [Deltaproteobacteria bacterium]|nr:MMPL family transporter [Deltaproteobacteria bacterium]